MACEEEGVIITCSVKDYATARWAGLLQPLGQTQLDLVMDQAVLTVFVTHASGSADSEPICGARVLVDVLGEKQEEIITDELGFAKFFTSDWGVESVVVEVEPPGLENDREINSSKLTLSDLKPNAQTVSTLSVIL
jgi:hypothetical protein